jgi:uncharacterized membrane protein
MFVLAPWYIFANPAMGKTKPHPLLLPGLIGLLSAIAFLLLAPSLPKSSALNSRFTQAFFFTVLALAVWVSQFWRRRRIAAFWASVAGFFLLHSLGVWAYSTFVQPILVWQWGVVLAVESFIAVAFIDRFTRWLSPSKL